MTLLIFSFVVTEKTSMAVKDTDEIMINIKKNMNKFQKDAIDGIIEDNTIIPGINGIQVDIDKSYENMKRLGVYNSNLIEYKILKPNISIQNKYDKYIISGNKNKNMVSLILLVDDNDNIDKILNVLNEKNVKANFFIDGNWLENNNDKLKEIYQMGYNIGNLSYNKNYNSSSFLWMDTIIKKVINQKFSYCYVEEKNEEVLKICNMNKDYTILPNIILKDNYLSNIKNKIKPGSIISLEINDELENNFGIIINYIKYKGFLLETLSNHLDENS